MWDESGLLWVEDDEDDGKDTDEINFWSRGKRDNFVVVQSYTSKKLVYIRGTRILVLKKVSK